MQIVFQENQAAFWIIESPRTLRTYLEELYDQTLGQEGNFVLSDQDMELDLSKRAEVILSPWEVDLNEKKVLNKIYSELKELAFSESYYLETQQLISSITSYFLDLEKDASVNLACEELDFSQLLKALGIRIDDVSDNRVDMLGQYLHVLSKLMGKQLVIFCNLSNYLEIWEIEALLKEAFYLKLYVLLIERSEYDVALDKKCYIIDRDNCEIF